MLPLEIRRMYDILVSFLGESKSGLDDNLQLQFSCPACQERDGYGERNKYHLDINLAKGLFQCWKCASINGEMQGSVYKLIKKYGNQELLKEYKDTVKAFRESSLYQLKFDKTDFQDDYCDIENDTLKLPKGFVKFQKGVNDSTPAFRYIKERGLDWLIINDYSLGFTGYHKDARKSSNRIILPSFNKYGELNYWTGRDYTGNDKRQRYDNPEVNRKDIIFNEDKVIWNADITLVEGPFDAIVIPNSIPLLGKQINDEYLLYHELFKNAHANINVWLDNDCVDMAKNIYRALNQGNLRGRIRIIISDSEKDASDIYKNKGSKGIVGMLKTAKKLPEINL